MLVKFCGLRTAADVKMAAQLKADFYGIIFHAKSPRYVDPQVAGTFPVIAARKVGVFTNNKPEVILNVFKNARLDMVQLHGDQSIDIARHIGKEKIIRVLWPMRYPSLKALQEDAKNFADHCAYYLLDAGEYGGGSGTTLRWKNLAGVKLPRPWFLAGGLNSENLKIALNECQPDGVDLNSGVEDEMKKKSLVKMEAAMRAIEVCI